MNRYKTALALLAILGAGIGAAAYLKYKNFSRYLIAEINSQMGKKLGRQVKFKGIAFSPLKGVIVDEPCVSRAPDFSKGVFFCARRAVVRPEFSALIKNRLFFSNVELQEPVMKIREAGGRWDFEDLLALLPKTSKGLHLTWNAKRLTLRNAKLEIDMGSSGRSVALENADISLLHYSALAGNFYLRADGGLKTVLNGQLFTVNAALKTDFNFEYAGPTSAFGGAEFAEAVFGASTLKKASIKWELFNINKPAPEKNYTASFKAQGLFIPAQSGGFKESVNSAMRLLSSVTGRSVPRVEDIEMGSLGLDFVLNNGLLRIKPLKLGTNFLNLDSEYELDGPARRVIIGFAAQTGAAKVNLTAKGPMDRPQIQPAMSDTLNRRLIEVIRVINASLLKIFPVAAQTSNV